MKLEALLVSILLSTAGMAQSAKTLPKWSPYSPRLRRTNTGRLREPLAEFEQFLRESLAARADLAPIEQRLLKLLESEATLAGKDVACRHLSLIGGRASVPVLSRLLLRTETSEMARYALERIPADDATATLRGALPKMAGKAKIGIINSLGARGDKGSVPLLKPLLVSSDPGIAGAAAVALAHIAGAEALEAIRSQRAKVPEAARFTVSEAYLACAAKAPREAAIRVAKELSGANDPVMIRIAALSLLASVANAEAVPVLASQLDSSDAKMQAAAVRLLSGIGSPVAARVSRRFPEGIPGWASAHPGVRLVSTRSPPRDRWSRR